MFEPEIHMMPDIMLRMIAIPSVRFRRAGVETIDEEEIRLPFGRNGVFHRGREFVGFRQLNTPVKHIIRIVVVLLKDRDLDVVITVKVCRVAARRRFAITRLESLGSHHKPDVIDAIEAGIPDFRLRRGQGVAPVSHVTERCYDIAERSEVSDDRAV